ncbi:MAG: amino acid ABC transporter permease [Microvirga sp.]
MGGWDQAVFLQVLTSPLILWATWTTIWIGTVAQALGTLIGVVVAPMMMSRARLPRFLAFLYLWVFRGTPLLAQILFFYAALPQMGLRFSVITTGILALSINEGARMAEIVRAGLLSVPNEQKEAAAALGLHRFKVFMLVVLPQAARAIVPPLSKQLFLHDQGDVASVGNFLRRTSAYVSAVGAVAGAAARSLYRGGCDLSHHHHARHAWPTPDRTSPVTSIPQWDAEEASRFLYRRPYAAVARNPHAFT